MSTETPSGAGQDFTTWWEHRPFANLNKRECELAWNAALAAQSQPAAAPSCGEPMVAEVESERILPPMKTSEHAKKTLASMSLKQEALSRLRERIEKLERWEPQSKNDSPYMEQDCIGDWLSREKVLAALRQEERKS